MKPVTCPACQSDNICLINDVSVWWRLASQDGSTLVFQSYQNTDDNYHNERLSCRDCATEFPIPAGIAYAFN